MTDYAEEVKVLYVKEVEFKDKAYSKKLGGEPFQDKIYRAFYHTEYNTYRILFEGATTNTERQMQGLIVDKFEIDDDRLYLSMVEVTPENCHEFDVPTDEVDKIAEWLTSDHEDIADLRIEVLLDKGQVQTEGDHALAQLIKSLSQEEQEELEETTVMPSEGEEIYSISDAVDADFWKALSELSHADEPLTRALGTVVKQVASCYKDKYHNSVIDTRGLILSPMGKGFNIGNATKYISRYSTEGFKKSGNPADLVKAVHYLLFELMRVENNTKPTE